MKTITQKLQEKARLKKRLKELDNRIAETGIWSNAWSSLNKDRKLILSDIEAIDEQLKALTQ